MNVVCALWFTITFISNQFASAEAIVRTLQESLSVLPVELVPVHQKLVTIRRQLVALAAKEGSHKAELKPLQEELRKIESLSTCFQVCLHYLPPAQIFEFMITNLPHITERA